MGSAPGMQGAEPLAEITLVTPFPAGEGGRGDIGGQESKLKAGQGGDKAGKPPAGYSGGKVRRVTSRASPPPGEWFAPAPSAAWVQPQGCKGRSPLHEKTLVTPFPSGEGGRGDRGQGSKLKAGGNRRQSRHAPPRWVQRRQGQAGNRARRPAGGKKSPTCRERQAGDAVISLSSPRRWWRFPGWTPPARPERCGRYPER